MISDNYYISENNFILINFNCQQIYKQKFYCFEIILETELFP
jgi:hypothetical protein